MKNPMTNHILLSPWYPHKIEIPWKIPWKLPFSPVEPGALNAPLPLLFLAQARGMGAERARGLAARPRDLGVFIFYPLVI